MNFRAFNIKLVRHSRPNEDGHWVQRVVPNEWPGDDKAGWHMLKTPPTIDTEILDGFHTVKIEETEPAPHDQPGTMREMAGFPAGDFDYPQPSGYGMRR